MVFQWTARSSYALTELVLFMVVCCIIFITFAIVLAVVLLNFKWNTTFFSVLRPLFENVFTTAIAFSHREKENIKIVFLGHIQQDDKYFRGGLRRSGARVWVHVYFTLLCSVAVLWFALVFSDAVLYHKTGTCLEMDTRDSDARCFLLPASNDDIPPDVQEIIDEEEGEAVPCHRVQSYLIAYNSTYDLSVICYISRLSPLPALGVAYGTMKTIIFGMVSLLSVFFAISRKIDAPSSLRHLSTIGIIHGIQIGISVALIVLMVIVLSSIHESSNSRNTTFDYLKGEQFFHSSVVALGAVTILITFGLFPWWAFKRLEPVGAIKLTKTVENGGVNKDDDCFEGEDLRDAIHNMILINQFSIQYRKPQETSNELLRNV